MAVVIDTQIDDAKIVAGLAKIGNAATETNAKIKKGSDEVAVAQRRTTTAAEQSTNSWIKYTKGAHEADKASRVSAEGLGFVTGALGRLNPQLALVGEQTIKQLPTLMKWGTSLSKFGVIGGSLAAIAGSAARIAYSMSQVSKETITAESELGKLIALGNSVKPGSFIDKMVSGTLGLFGVNRADVEEQQRDLAKGASWKMNEAASGQRGAGLLNQSMANRDLRLRMESDAGEVSGINSTDEIMRQIKDEKKRMEGLRLIDSQKAPGAQEALSPEEIQASDAKLAALDQRYKEITDRIENLRAIENDMAVEESQRWMDEIKSSKEATEQIDKLSKEFYRLYNTNQLNGEKEKELLGGLTKLHGKKNELIAEEKQKTDDLRTAKKMLAEQEREAHNQRIADLAGQATQGDGAMGKQLIDEVDRVRERRGEGDARLKKKAKRQAGSQLREKLDEAEAAYQDEADAAARDLQSGDINSRESRQRLETARQARNKAKKAAIGERGDDQQSAFLDLQKSSRDGILDFAEKNGDINARQAEVAKKTVDLIEQKSRELEDVKTLFGQLERRLGVMARPAPPINRR